MCDVLQVEYVVCVVFGNQQQVFGVWVDFFDGGYGGLYGQWQYFGGEIVEVFGEEICVDWCQFEVGVV